VRELARAQVPDEPGVYLWRHDGQAVYVGMATSLRGRAWSKHLGAGLSLSGHGYAVRATGASADRSFI